MNNSGEKWNTFVSFLYVIISYNDIHITKCKNILIQKKKDPENPHNDLMIFEKFVKKVLE